jgi:hypothetical protein
MKFKLTRNESDQITNVDQVKDLQFWRENAEEDYLKVPISVLKYISKLETELENIYSIEDMRGMYDKSCGLWGLGEVSNQTENNERFQALINQFKKELR